MKAYEVWKLQMNPYICLKGARFRDHRCILTTFDTPSVLQLHLPTETGAALSEMELLLLGDVQVNDRHDNFKQRL